MLLPTCYLFQLFRQFHAQRLQTLHKQQLEVVSKPARSLLEDDCIRRKDGIRKCEKKTIKIEKIPCQ